MNRLLLLLIPIVALAASEPRAQLGQTTTPSATTTAANAANAAQSWTASIEAEINKEYDKAITATRAFQQAGGDAFMANERLGWLSYLNGDYTKADQYYGEASRSLPTAMNPLFGLLNVAQAQKDAKKIERAAQSLLHNEPSNYRAQMALANLHLSTRDYQKSASEYRRVLMYYPDDLDATSGLAWSIYYLGSKHDALVLFRKIVTISPDYAYAQRGIELAGAQ